MPHFEYGCPSEMRNRDTLVAIGMMIALALTRFTVGIMPPNFSAVYALAFCAGLYFRGSMAWWLPFATLAVSDIILNVVIYEVSILHPSFLGNYLAYAVLIGLGRKIGPKAKMWKLVGGGILGGLLFYLITNAASWLWNPYYTKNLMGLIQALTTGQPPFPHTWEFFRNTLMSGGLFGALFVAAMKSSEAPEPATEDEEEHEEVPDLEPEESQA